MMRFIKGSLAIFAALVAVAPICQAQSKAPVIGRVELVKPPEARETLSISVGSEGVVEVQASDRARYLSCQSGRNSVYELKSDAGLIRVLVIAKEPGELCLVFGDVADGTSAVVLEQVTVTISSMGDPDNDPDEIFLDALLEAYEADPNPDQIKSLADVYDAAIWGISANQTKTVGQLFADLSEKAKERGVDSALPRVQQVISGRLSRFIGNPIETPDRVLPNVTTQVLRDLANVLREIGTNG